MYLDGVYRLTHTMYGNLYHLEEEIRKPTDDSWSQKRILPGIKVICERKRNMVVQHVWTRMIFLVQMMGIVISTTITQLLRGSFMIVSGIAHRNVKHLKQGGLDLLSLLVQLVVLPVLGVIGTLCPRGVIHVYKSLAGNILEPYQMEKIEGKSSLAALRVLTTISKIFSHGSDGFILLMQLRPMELLDFILAHTCFRIHEKALETLDPPNYVFSENKL